jgi:hypothetical protein
LDALGRPLAALQELDVARTLQTGSREVDLFACRLAVRASLRERALQECEGLLARYGDAWDTAGTAAWALANLGRTSRAAELSQSAVERQPGLPAAWLEHGRMLTPCKSLRKAIAATEMGWSLIPAGDGFYLATLAAIDLSVLHRRLSYPDWARQWALQAQESCATLSETDPVRARIARTWIQAELGSTANLPTTGLGDVSPVFMRIEERRLLTSQISETLGD